ncbi:hypothetical protein [Yinghuangia soli]|uniref:HTTM-like domain-containing protein n=1 Tax=Yinghuangia soli TaxID=2908204 RepID=A0AA41PZL4_9ACTN|nr:hypothetical protein [Yinghuangia soli]MCF2528805.1 hypothetical protein [Yinghuangia soli]
MLTAAVAAREVLAIGGLGLAVSAARDLRVRHEYAPSGVLTYAVEASGRDSNAALLWLSTWEHYRVALAVQFAAGAAAPVVALAAPTPAAAVAALLLAACAVLTLQRSSYGLDGADQMFALAMISCTAALVAGERYGRLFLYFLAAQLILSYLIAGIAKLVSPVWRDGTCLAGILSTKAYSSPRLAALLRRHRTFALGMAWSVMLFEVTFIAVPFLAPVLDGTVMLAGLVCGVLFHLGISVTMRLHTFVFAFTGAYPALLYAMDNPPM